MDAHTNATVIDMTSKWWNVHLAHQCLRRSPPRPSGWSRSGVEHTAAEDLRAVWGQQPWNEFKGVYPALRQTNCTLKQRLAAVAPHAVDAEAWCAAPLW